MKLTNNFVIYKEEAKELANAINPNYVGCQEAKAFFEKVAKSRHTFTKPFSQLPTAVKYLFNYKYANYDDTINHPIISAYYARYLKAFKLNENLRVWVSNQQNYYNNCLRTLFEETVECQVPTTEGDTEFFPTQAECIDAYIQLSINLANDHMCPCGYFTTRKKLIKIWCLRHKIEDREFGSQKYLLSCFDSAVDKRMAVLDLERKERHDD